MLKKFVLGSMVVVAALLGNACGDDGSGDSPAGPADSEVTLSSSSEDVISGNGSSSSVTESPSTSSGQVPQSAESDGPSSSEKAVDGSSSSDGKASSSSGKVESSSSGKGEKSSSSEGAAGSSSAKVEESSSSAKVDESSSSMKAAESSSSVKVEESSSSEKNEISSSSEKPVESSSSEKVVESSSSEKSSSSAGIPSKLYDCEIYKCVTTKYLNPDIEYGEYLDVRDTQVYRTVQIGEQVWMAQNLNYKNDNQSFCFDSDTLYCKEKGRLYTWENALKVCPEGWHLPDSSEYNALIDFVEKNNNGLPTKKSLTSGTFNIFGFSIILGSGYVVRGEYSNEGGGNGNSYFWTASETDGLDSSRPPETFARARGIRTSSNALVKLSWEKIHALAIRCIQN